MKLLSRKILKHIFQCGNQHFRIVDQRTVISFATAVFICYPISGKCFANSSSFSAFDHTTKCQNVVNGNSLGRVITPFGSDYHSVDSDSNWICDRIELFPFVSAFSQPMPSNESKSEREKSPKNSPCESNKGRICVEKKNYFSQSEVLKILLIGPLVSFLLFFPLGLYLTAFFIPELKMRRARWHKLQAIKSKRWQRVHSEPYRIPFRKRCQWFWL